MSLIISGSEARQLVEERQAQLVDVRSANEFMQGSVPGAVNLPLHVLPLHAANSLDPLRPVVVFCLSGARSAQAKMLLQGLGFGEVHNVGNPQNYLAG